jgi:hypothetical protein
MAQRPARLTPPEVAVEVLAILEGAGIPSAIGGAIALGYYTAPRGTLDADINVFVDAEDAVAALAALRSGGIQLAVEAAAERVARTGDLYLEHRGCRVDLFFNSIPLHEEAARRAREVALLGRQVRILSPEDLVVLKLLFNRHKDIVDVEHVLEQGGDSLDAQYVRRWLVECVGEDDERVAVWDRLRTGDRGGTE